MEYQTIRIWKSTLKNLRMLSALTGKRMIELLNDLVQTALSIEQRKQGAAMPSHEQYMLHREVTIKRAKEYYATHKEQKRLYDIEYRRKYYELNKKDVIRKSYRRHIKKYGITGEEYDVILAKQNGLCAVCGRAPGKHSLHIDHDHVTGKVRGLLCHKCNVALGLLNDDVHLIFGLAMYLKGEESFIREFGGGTLL